MSGFRRAIARGRSGLIGALAAGLVFGGPRVATAQVSGAPQAGDKAAAETLFNEGRTLLGQNKLNEACAKLAESNRLDTGIGTMLYLAECYERSGKTASAWAQFREAQSVAARTKDDREKVARARADKLEPKLSRLVVVVPPDSEIPDLAVTRDGVSLGRAVWGEETPVDPGVHVIRATAPGRTPFETQVTVQPGAPKARVVVPLLEAGVAASEGPERGSPDEDGPRDRSAADGDDKLPPKKIVAIALGGVGAAGLVVGTIFGLGAKGKLSDSEAHCDARFCDQQGLDLRDDAQGQALVSTISFVVAGAALTAGAVLWFTTPTASSKSASTQAVVVPVVLPGGGALSGAVRF